MSERLRSLAFIGPVIGLALIPLAAFGLLTLAAVDAENAALTPEDAATASVGSMTNEARQQVEIVVTTGSTTQVLSPSAGVLTALNADVGTTISPGATLMTVNDSPILAYTSPVPLHRDLTLGDKGPDVQKFQDFLNAAGFNVGQADGVFGAETRAAVRGLQRQAGLEADGVGTRSQLAWVPDGVTTVGELDVTLGQSIDVGTPVVSSPADVTSVKITPGDTASASVTLPEGSSPALIAGAQVFPLSSLVPSAEESASLLAFLEAQVEASSLTAETNDGVITFRGALISDASAREIATVPSRALLTRGPTSCIFLVAGATNEAIVIDDPHVVPGTLDTLEVPAELVGSQVILNPMSLAEGVKQSCGSK